MPKKRSKYYEENLRKIAKLNLFSDFFMTVCFDKKPKFAEKVLSIILNMPKLKVIDVKTQVSLTNILERTVRLDVLAIDSLGKSMNIEVQRDNAKAIPQRARYHSSILDATTFKIGQKFHELCDNYVIFITEHDYFKKKQPIYEITRMVRQTGEVFRDGSFIIYVNGAYRDATPLGKLMHDFTCTEAQNIYFKELAEVVKYYKETEEGQDYMCEILDDIRKESEMRGLSKGRAAGRKEGRAEAIDNTLKALSLIKADKYASEEIASLSGLSLDEVKALQESISGNG
ncbi:MAG: PD-(D/E)XK nuclease family transposase [bacterium]|nr:PD-(D/E)XK nuclease family transposase [bacterium]